MAYFRMLKPLGLQCLITSECKICSLLKRIPHISNFQNKFFLPSPRQTCQCAIAREIGFKDESHDLFQKKKEFFIVCPTHPCIEDDIDDEQFEVPSIHINVLEEKATNEIMIFSEGSLDLILDFCSDYWDGESIFTMDSNVLIVFLIYR